MKIAVTGASGRVGTAVVERALRDGHEVVAVDRTAPGSTAPATEVVELDMQDYDAVTRALSGCDGLVHLAAITGPGRLPDHVVHDHNVVSSYHALSAAAELGIRRISQASSVNAIGGRFSRSPRYDYFPIDEQHAAYVEDPYSLSKWICEQQAESIARQYPGTTIASLRLHGIVGRRADAVAWLDWAGAAMVRQLWGYTSSESAARAFLAGLTADFVGHEAFYIVAPDTMMDTPSMQLAGEHYPDVRIRGDLSGGRSFFDCSKAETMLGWTHEPPYGRADERP